MNTTSEIKNLKEQWPDIYKLCFSRIYEDNHRFCDWRLPLYFHANSMIRAAVGPLRKLVGDDGQTQEVMLNYQPAVVSVKYNNPLFFVGRDLLEACRRSTPPKGLQLNDLHMPFECFAFVLPRGALMHRGREVHFISVMLDKIGTKKYRVSNQEISVTSADDALILSTLIPDDMEALAIRMNQEGLDDGMENIDWTDHVDASVPVHHLGVPEELGTTMINIAINLILAMQARPELVTKGAKKKCLRRDRSTELWTPNVIGAKYQTQRTSEGTHASPRAHWRRGHFRNQPIGSRGATERKYKTIWIEPILVSAT